MTNHSGIDCTTCRAHLSDLLEAETTAPGGVVASPELVAAQAHIAACSDCTRELEMLRTARTTLRSLPEQMPPIDLRARIRAATVDAPAQRSFSDRFAAFWNRPAGFAWAGSAALAAFCVLLATRHQEELSVPLPAATPTAAPRIVVQERSDQAPAVIRRNPTPVAPLPTTATTRPRTPAATDNTARAPLPTTPEAPELPSPPPVAPRENRRLALGAASTRPEPTRRTGRPPVPGPTRQAPAQPVQPQAVPPQSAPRRDTAGTPRVNAPSLALNPNSALANRSNEPKISGNAGMGANESVNTPQSNFRDTVNQRRVEKSGDVSSKANLHTAPAPFARLVAVAAAAPRPQTSATTQLPSMQRGGGTNSEAADITTAEQRVTNVAPPSTATQEGVFTAPPTGGLGRAGVHRNYGSNAPESAPAPQPAPATPLAAATVQPIQRLNLIVAPQRDVPNARVRVSFKGATPAPLLDISKPVWTGTARKGEAITVRVDLSQTTENARMRVELRDARDTLVQHDEIAIP